MTALKHERPTSKRAARRFQNTLIIFLILILNGLILAGHIHAAQLQFCAQKDDLVISPGLHKSISAKAADEPVTVWVLFTDKGFFTEQEHVVALNKAGSFLSERALSRRARMGAGAELSLGDLPVCQDYVDQVSGMSLRHRATSRWLNAMSVEIESGELEKIAKYPFVRKIQEVARSRRSPIPEYRSEDISRSEGGRAQAANMNYGSSFNQLDQINVPAVHDLGYNGEGILICILDTGFYLAHESLQHINVLGQWDFIFDDGNTANEEEDSPAQHSHGSEVLSVVGGAKDGQLYGPAYGATYLLAKTEDMRSETPVEEDFWVAGVEWADQMGADVVTSSLGYADWYSYDDGDYNGDIAVTTRAADLAASKGIVVCNAVGNEGQQAGSIVAPADADSILACGAVDASGNLAGFSSIGPTSDGRIKPEVVAKGRSTYMANPYKSAEYSYGSGTSYSTPLVAGCAALILQAHPDWTPMMVREALMMTASRADRPGNYFGWGIVDCLKAINYQFTSVADEEEGRTLPDRCDLLQNYPNPFNPSTTISYSLPVQSIKSKVEGEGTLNFELSPLHVTLKVFNVMGQEMRTLVDGIQDAGFYSVIWDGRNDNGRDVSSGFYMCRLEADHFAATRAMVLLR